MKIKRISRERIVPLLLTLTLLFLAACGTLEVDVEPTVGPESTVAVETAATASPEATTAVSEEPIDEPTIVVSVIGTPGGQAEDVAEPTPEPTPTAEAELDLFQVAYVKDANIWLWREGNEPVTLTKNGGVETVWLSDDGRLVAFTRGGNIWAVRSDGSGERQLTVDEDFAGISLGADWDSQIIAFTPYQIAWRPGSHTLYFNTAPQLQGPGLLLSDDLWSVDVDSGMLTNLLSPGEGGQFHVSPDGRHLALVTAGDISLLNAETFEQRELLTYSPIVTFSEFRFYAEPVWAADSSGLAVAIPPVDRMASADQLTAVWTMSLDGRSARLVGHISVSTSLQAQTLIAPDLRHIAYMVGEGASTPPSFQIAVSEIGEEGMGAAMMLPGEAEALDSWSPDGRLLVYSPPFDGEVPRRVMIGLDGSEDMIGEEGLAVFQITWVDEARFLYLQHDGVRAWNLFLASPESEESFAIDGVIGAPPAFDFST